MARNSTSPVTSTLQSSPNTSKRSPWLVPGAVLGTAAVGVTAAVAFTMGSGTQQVVTAVPGAPAPSAKPAKPAPLDKKSAKVVVTKYLDTVARDMAVKHPKDKVAKLDFDTVAAGAALDDLEAQQAELDSNGWTRKGEVTVEDLTVVKSDLGAKTPTVVARACFDSSAVKLYDAEGVAFVGGDTDSRRSLNTVTLQFVKGVWLVADRAFPEDPSC